MFKNSISAFSMKMAYSPHGERFGEFLIVDVILKKILIILQN